MALSVDYVCMYVLVVKASLEPVCRDLISRVGDEGFE
jgi:hypothetical protein